VRRAALIYNPTAGRRRHAQVLDAILATLRNGGFAVEPAPTTCAAEATLLARGLAASGCEAVFSLGGDGTAREVAAGLLGTPAALGFLPGGTANVLTLGFGLPRDPVRAAAALCAAPVRDFDVGRVEGTEGAEGAAPFLMMVSAGLDAAVLAALDLGLKHRFGKGAFLWQGLREWWRYGYPGLEIVADGHSSTATFAAAANIPYYAGSFQLAPGARPDDRRLDLVLFRGSGRQATLEFGLDLLRGAHVRRRDVTVLRVEEVVFTAPAGAAAQVDGDLCAERLPLTVRLAPERLKVLFPGTPG
jgi:YegS/Rv2252/BmrU family lipid kinase